MLSARITLSADEVGLIHRALIERDYRFATTDQDLALRQRFSDLLDAKPDEPLGGEARTPAQRMADGLNAFEAKRPNGPYCTFQAEAPGRVYTKVTKTILANGFNGGVHCFVGTASGAVYKAEGYNKPAKGVRFNTVEEALLAASADPLHAYTGGYLYKRGY